MNKKIYILFFCLLTFLLPKISNSQTAVLFEGFETDNCEDSFNPFYEGCIPDWISVSGTADLRSSYSNITPCEGSNYVHMYSAWRGWTCPSEPLRGESIALNYTFQSGQTYTIKCKLAWDGPPSFPRRHTMKTDFILTNNRANQFIPGNNVCAPGDILPAINPKPLDRIVGTKNMPNDQFEWVEFECTFTAKGEFNQLWIRPETISTGPEGRNINSDNDVYLDAFEIETCVNPSTYNPDFTMALSSDPQGNVTVTSFAGPNNIPLLHWWDVFYSDEGSISDNDEVPGNPTQCCFNETSTFSNNLQINTWYYIKHGVWQQGCGTWREKRRAFIIQIMTQNSGEEPKYKIEIKDIDFEPTELYQASMIEMVSNLSEDEIKWNNQKELQLIKIAQLETK